jgi:4-hydroxybenzoate polyprenyltransferase
MKMQYLAQLRESSPYNNIRRFASAFEWVGYLLALSSLVTALMTASKAGNANSAMLSLVLAVAIAVVSRFVKMCTCMLIDMADAKLDMAHMMRAQGNAKAE